MTKTEMDNIENRISFLKSEIKRLNFEQSFPKTKAEKLEREEQVDSYNRELLSLLQEQLEANTKNIEEKHFNREICLKNVDYLLTKQNKKLGELEEKSGNYPGYLSRMKSGKSSSDPSIEFLMTAAEELNVPLELLVSSDLTEMTSTEEFILKFLNKVIDNTKKDELRWTRETISQLEKLGIERDMNGYEEVNHPLYTVGGDGEGEEYYEFPVYVSLFFRNCGVTPCGNGYNAILSGTDNTLYIMECSKGDDSLTWNKDRFYELYLVERGRYGNYDVKKLCNTIETRETIVVTVDSLVKNIIASLNRIHIDSDVKEILNAYIDGISIPNDPADSVWQ